MSERDLALKVNSRRLLWKMGFSTRVDVPLRAYVPRSDGRRRRYEEFTDLDVLGISVAPGFAIRQVIVDCKTTPKNSTERMFWIRGVADFFSADDAWMVRSGGVTAAARQLSGRLGISVMEPPDLSTLEGYHHSDVDLESGAVSFLFDEKSVSGYLHSFTSLDRKLDKLIEYRQYDYWVYEEYRNLVQVVAHLQEAAPLLDSSNPAHRALFYDYAWLYTFSVARAVQYIRAAHATSIDSSLREYFFGGQVALREKEQLAEFLVTLGPDSDAGPAGVMPEWYPQLRDLVTRHLRRPGSPSTELRYAEWLAESQIAKPTATLPDAFATTFDIVSAKLLGDVCGFLVAVSRLPADFRSRARQDLALSASPAVDSDPVTPPLPLQDSPDERRNE